MLKQTTDHGEGTRYKPNCWKEGHKKTCWLLSPIVFLRWGGGGVKLRLAVKGQIVEPWKSFAIHI